MVIKVLVDRKLVDYLENLSCLSLPKDEKERLMGDLNQILQYMAKLGELDTLGVPECSHPFDDVNCFRDDEVVLSLGRNLILQNAPEHNDETFIAPMAVE